MRSPWTWALLAALGVTLLVPSGLALVAPPEFLDAAVALGDRALFGGLLALFGLTALVVRLFIKKRDPADFVEQTPPPSVKQDESYLR